MTHHQSTVYIAGPMRGRAKFNFPAFDLAAELGRRLGWIVISPADLDRQNGFDENAPPELTLAVMREFIRRDVAALIDTMKAENGDAIALLPGWEESTGAKAELALAKWAGLRVLDACTFQEFDAELIGVSGYSCISCAH